ncbi:MAG: hypothetical protein AB1305_00185 [Candidatus Hadarchaeota archaeon]
MPLTEKAVNEIEEILLQIKELASEGATILVEGDTDVRGLRSLGISGDIRKITGGKSLLNFLEGLSGVPAVVILTDFDRTGERLSKFCSKHLASLGVKTINEPRRMLKSIAGREIKEIADLSKALLKLRDAG